MTTTSPPLSQKPARCWHALQLDQRPRTAWLIHLFFAPQLCSSSIRWSTPLATQAEAWQAIPGVSEWVMGIIKRFIHSNSLKDPRALHSEVMTLLGKGAIERVRPAQSVSGFYSRYFFFGTQRRRSHFSLPVLPYFPCLLSSIVWSHMHSLPFPHPSPLSLWTRQPDERVCGQRRERLRVRMAACWSWITSLLQSVSMVYVLLLRCFSCSYTVLPKEHSLGVIFFLLTFLLLCCHFLQFPVFLSCLPPCHICMLFMGRMMAYFTGTCD